MEMESGQLDVIVLGSGGRSGLWDKIRSSQHVVDI